MKYLGEVKKKSGNDEVSASKQGKLDSSKKSKVPVVGSISQALEKHEYGFIFTTPKSDRIYVITQGTWGDKSANKVVKGFPGGTEISVIKGFGKRTKVKHGPTKAPSSTKDAGKKGYATRKMKDGQKRKKDLD